MSTKITDPSTLMGFAGLLFMLLFFWMCSSAEPTDVTQSHTDHQVTK